MTLADIARIYRRRQDRDEHPDGSFDNAGRWYPSDAEWRACCGRVRSPSRAYPYSLMKHCRSVAHVAALHGVTATELRRAIAAPPEREGGDYYYKAVAVTEDGRYLSIFDGETEYRIGRTLRQAPRRDHNGGYYVYASPDAARNVAVPPDSALRDAPRAVLRVRAEGAYCRYPNGKLAFSRVTPMEVVS